MVGVYVCDHDRFEFGDRFRFEIQKLPVDIRACIDEDGPTNQGNGASATMISVVLGFLALWALAAHSWARPGRTATQEMDIQARLRWCHCGMMKKDEKNRKGNRIREGIL